MKNKICTTLILLFGLFPLAAQSVADSLHIKIKNADRVELLSHEDLYFRETKAELAKGRPGHWRTIVNGLHEVNDSIVVERKTLGADALEELLHLLSKQYKEEIPMDRNACFDPHETILLYKNGRYAYIDICFGCRQFEASKDIKINERFLSTAQNWDDLKKFFRSQGITYKIE